MKGKADGPDLATLFHRLNNQLGIILANAELLENKSTDQVNRARAGQVVASALEAMAVAKELRATLQNPPNTDTATKSKK